MKLLYNTKGPGKILKGNFPQQEAFCFQQQTQYIQNACSHPAFETPVLRIQKIALTIVRE
jgi:hypothetical protein|tara:strand:- start:156 stop:335 length:180 start_codon:yes stop_codon:yes gene_type:complete